MATPDERRAELRAEAITLSYSQANQLTNDLRTITALALGEQKLAEFAGKYEGLFHMPFGAITTTVGVIWDFTLDLVDAKKGAEDETALYMINMHALARQLETITAGNAAYEELYEAEKASRRG